METPKAISLDVWNSAVDDASQNFKNVCMSLKSFLVDNETRRSVSQSTAQTDFSGYFKDVFSRNGNVRAKDCDRLVVALQAIFDGTEAARESAMAEQNRIRIGRAWKVKHDDWQIRRDSGLITGQLHDLLYGEPQIDNKYIDPGPAPRIVFPDAVITKPNLPAVGSAYVGSQTSSARPSNLDSFVGTTAEMNSALPSKIKAFENAYLDFESAWLFKTGPRVVSKMDEFIDALNVFHTANVNDTQWIRAISAAFKAAGSAGSVASLSNHALAFALENAGLADSINRDSLKIPKVALVGIVPSTGYADDPVNTATGNFIEPETDLVFAGGNTGLEFSRMYNSLVAVSQRVGGMDESDMGVFGLGWSCVLDQHFEEREDCFVWVREDGREISFDLANLPVTDAPVSDSPVSDSSDSLVSSGLSGFSGSLHAREDNFWLESNGTGWLIHDNTGVRWSFTRSGQWVETWLDEGAVISVEYAADGSVCALVHSRGRRIDFEYDGLRVVVARGSDGRRVEYFYDDDGCLCEVKSGLGSRTYVYNVSGLLERVVSAAGVVEVENTYDVSGRVVSQVSQYGRVSRYTYLPGRVTEVADVDGSRANTWVADDKGRNTAVIDSDGFRHSKVYDKHGNLILERDRADQVTVYFYDDRGRVTKIVLPSKAEIQYQWDDQDRVIAVIGANGGSVTYQYVGLNRNPSRVVDPNGGVTRLEWDNGLLTKMVDPEGVGLSFSYDVYGDLVSAINACGDRVCLVRDRAGNVVELVSALGHSTRFTYNANNVLTSKTNPDGGRWVYESDNAGQLTCVIDPFGAATRYSYASNGESFQVSDPLGRVTTREVDDLGNISALTLPDGDKWLFDYDGLSRLKSVIDPNNGVWGYEYSQTGELVRTVDPTGIGNSITGRIENGMISALDNTGKVSGVIEFDKFGQPVKGLSPDGGAEIVTYDLCGRPVEFIDGEGGLTLIKRDFAGRVISYTSPQGRVQVLGYDACGRLSTVSTSGGDNTTISYDADSRIVSVTNPCGEVSTYEYDVCGRITKASIPGGGVYRYRYDKCGRIVYALDPVTGPRHFEYDNAGQLVKAVNGLGGLTRYVYDNRGRLVKVVDPRGYPTKYAYDSFNQIVSVKDALGRTISNAYDAAGRLITRRDGNGDTISFKIDENGRPCALSINNKLFSETVSKDREVQVTDWGLAVDGKPVVHTLTYDRKGKLVGKTSLSPAGVKSVSRWGYDRDGLRTSFTVNGQTSSYEYDVNGRLTAFNNPVYGTTRFNYDACGRLIHSNSKNTDNTWKYVNGFIAFHCSKTENKCRTTSIKRDTFGRPVTIAHDNEIINYSYNDAGQLVSLETNKGVKRGWEFDTSGHMNASWHENNDGEKTSQNYYYDPASQLVKQITNHDGKTINTSYQYDNAGRRTASQTDNGIRHAFQWDPRGWLTRHTETNADNTTLDITTTVDGLGQITRIGDIELAWDYAATIPTLAGIGGTSVASLPGGILLAGDIQTEGVWRQITSGATRNPYEITALNLPGTPEGIQFTPSGPVINGNVWMGARIYNPASASFLSTDPLQAPPASIWESNPYNYLANNPLTLTDPLGLKPITDTQIINKYNAQASQSLLSQTGNWITNNWEYLAAGAAVIGGVALMATGVGGPAGIALMAAGGASFSAGTTIATQKFFNNNVNWSQVGVDAVFGAVTGAVGGVGIQITKKISLQTGKAIAANVLVNGGVGSLSSGITNVAKNGLNDPKGLLGSMTGGFISGGIGGLAGPTGGTLAKQYGVLKAGTYATLLDIGGGFIGQSTDDLITDGKINILNSTVAAGTNGATSLTGSFISGKYSGFEMNGVHTINNMGVAHPRTLHGLFNFEAKNTQMLWKSSLTGAGIGEGYSFVADSIRDYLDW